MTPARKRLACAPLVATLFVGGVTYCGARPPRTPPPASSASTIPIVALPESPTLTGFVDLHAHPLSNLGFAGKLVYGGIDWASDGGSLLPADPDCHENVRATSVPQALGHDNSTHGGWGIDLDPVDLLDGTFGVTNSCGDAIRQQVISAVQAVNDANNPGSDASGYPDFPAWPGWNDITHQAMWVDAINRTYRAGLRVMVALAVNSQTLADAVAGPSDGPDDDMSSADLQIAEIKGLASRHADWMEVAYSAADLHRIVSNGKLAVVLGMEVDNIGNFNRTADLSNDAIRGEIARLHAEGVRYVFPVHLIDNPFGTTAAYQDIFNLSNLREAGHFWNLVCAAPDDHIDYRYTMGNPLTQAAELDLPSTFAGELAALMVAKLGMLSDTFDPPTVPVCAHGMVNRGVDFPGLTPAGQFAIREMMRQGMLIDVDHMSQASVNDALAIAVAENYPVNSGHNSVRSPLGGTERALTRDQYAKIGAVHGMAGVGSAGTDHVDWVARCNDVVSAMGAGTDAIAFGTDADGLSPLMPPPPTGSNRIEYSDAFPKSALGNASWDYNDAGVAHYGMIADFVRAISGADGGSGVVADLMRGAQYFHETWKKAEAYGADHRLDAGSGPPSLAAAPGPRMIAAAAAAPAAVAAAVAAPCAAGTVYKAACNACLPRRARCPALPHPVCGPRRRPDRWGLCMTASARAAANAPSTAAAAAAPAAARVASGGPGPSLAPGAYTLVLVGDSGSAPPPNGPAGRTVKGFDVDVATNGRRITLQARNPAPGSKPPQSSGGFRGDRFVLRVNAGDQVVVLVGAAGAVGPARATQVHGGFVAHMAGQPAISGTFVLQQTSTLKRAPKGVKPYETMGSFLADLRR